MGNKIKVGDKVRYKSEFLRSTGQYTGDIPFARGTIKEIKKYSGDFAIALIDWQNENVPARVNIGNLEKTNSLL